MRVPFLFLLALSIQQVCMPALAEDANDSYHYREKCPKDEGDEVTRENETKRVAGGVLSSADSFKYIASTSKSRWDNLSYFIDKWSFAQCNCTSYVASKLNEAWGNTTPEFKNNYYGETWGSGYHWFSAARAAEIGITGARDRFTFEKSRLNGAFKGDVAVWEAWTTLRNEKGEVIRSANPYGHVALVEEDGEPDGVDNGVKCVQVSEYNWDSALNFGRRTGTRKVCKSTDPNDVRFPHYFVHITQDREYCLANPTKGLCSRISGQVATTDSKYYGVFGGAGTDTFNLKVDFDIVNSSTGQEIVAGTKDLVPGQVVNLKVQVQAKNGNTSTHMRPGKNRIEVDYYVRTGDDDWVFYRRAYIQATNLPSGGTHTETVQYTVPKNVSTVSFKVKIDAEDEAYEANEGDNWSRIETFSVYYRTGIHRILRTED